MTTDQLRMGATGPLAACTAALRALTLPSSPIASTALLGVSQ